MSREVKNLDIIILNSTVIKKVLSITINAYQRQVRGFITTMSQLVSLLKPDPITNKLG